MPHRPTHIPCNWNWSTWGHLVHGNPSWHQIYCWFLNKDWMPKHCLNKTNKSHISEIAGCILTYLSVLNYTSSSRSAISTYRPQCAQSTGRHGAIPFIRSGRSGAISFIRLFKKRHDTLWGTSNAGKWECVSIIHVCLCQSKTWSQGVVYSNGKGDHTLSINFNSWKDLVDQLDDWYKIVALILPWQRVLGS